MPSALLLLSSACSITDDDSISGASCFSLSAEDILVSDAFTSKYDRVFPFAVSFFKALYFAQPDCRIFLDCTIISWFQLLCGKLTARITVVLYFDRRSPYFARITWDFRPGDYSLAACIRSSMRMTIMMESRLCSQDIFWRDIRARLTCSACSFLDRHQFHYEVQAWHILAHLIRPCRRCVLDASVAAKHQSHIRIWASIRQVLSLQTSSLVRKPSIAPGLSGR